MRVTIGLSVRRQDCGSTPGLTAQKADIEHVPATGTLGQYVDYARAAAEAGVHELFIDFGQSRVTLEERTDMAGRFIDGVRAG
ncbi:hypothetical protein [Actinacidiphila glaucinigra]|uniref:hypothetical protein n=1 Tax=Actinacidiphila glaucinigra TaxID=235986 RepID=UPI003817BB85